MALLRALLAAAAVAVSARPGVLHLRGGSAALRSSVSLADASETEILSVPGFDGPLPSKMYGGYISVDDANGREARLPDRPPSSASHALSFHSSFTSSQSLSAAPRTPSYSGSTVRPRETRDRLC